MNKNKKAKATSKIKKRIYVRQNISEPKKSRLSELDVHFDTVNPVLRKRIRDRITLDSIEKKELKPILNQFQKSECYKDEVVCNSDCCRFAGVPDDWVKNEGFEYLCDLVYNYIDNGPNLVPPGGCDAMHKVVDGHACSNH